MPDSLIKDAIAQYDDSTSFYEHQRKKCLEDIKFAYIYENQWEEDMIQKRRDRPRYTINRIVHTLNQANGAFKQNRITGKVRGWKSFAQKKVADTFTGLIRNIENVSKANQTYADAFTHINAGGFSAWRIRADFNDDDSFDQDLMIEAIMDPWMSVWPDASSRRFDSKDWDYCLITKDMSKARAQKLYPGKSLSDFPTEHLLRHERWITDATVKIAEYWVREPTKRTLLQMSNGSVDYKDKLKPILDELANQGVTIIKSRVVNTHKVKSYIISANEVLEGPFEWLGKWIPIIPAFGYRLFIDNEFHCRGKVRYAKDAQRIYNYATSANIEAIALSPKDPIFITAEQIRGFENRYQKYNLQNNPFLFYNADDKAPPPFKLGAPAVQSGLITQTQQAALDIQTTMGSFAPSQGQALSPDQSGAAIQSLQQASDQGSFDLLDNLANSIEFTWETLVDVLPRYYDTDRQERVINANGDEEVITINHPVVDTQTGEVVLMNDITVGKYDVVVDIGSSLKTQRMEATTLYGNILQTNPALAEIIFDEFVKHLDIPNVEEMHKRVRSQMIKSGKIDPTPEEEQELAQNQKPDPMMQIQGMMAKEQFRKQQLENQKLELDNQDKANAIDLEGEKIRAEIGKIVAQTIAEYKKAEVPIRPEDLLIRTLQNDKLIKDLMDVSTGQNGTAPPLVEAVNNQGGEGLAQ